MDLKIHISQLHSTAGAASLSKLDSARRPRPLPVLITLILGLFVLTIGGSSSRSALRAESGGESNEDERGFKVDLISAMRGTEDAGRYDRALEQWRQLTRASSLGLSTTGSIGGTVWKPIGPSPIVETGCCGSTISFAASGRVNSIAVDPTDSNVLYLGSAGGGVWKSTDRGAQWTPITDQEVSLGIGSSHAIAIDPNHHDTIYAGTSSWALLYPDNRSQSRGILKSTDGGASWLVLGSGIPTGNNGNATHRFNGRNISTILVDPADSDTLYAAAGRSGDLQSGGVFWSTDGGLNWTQGVGTDGLFVESLVLDTSSSAAMRTLYAGALGQGVLKSTDGGESWKFVLMPTTTEVFKAAPDGILKTMVALAPIATPPNPAGQVIYASIQVIDHNGDLTNAIFENTVGGAEERWVKKTSQVVICANGFCSLQGAGFSDMIVDPGSLGDGVNDVIYWGGLSQFISTDSGSTFSEIGQINGTHGDHQTWTVVPQANTLYAGDDGGIWRSENRGMCWTGTTRTGFETTINAGGLQTATLYQLAVKQDASASINIAGTQDSGILRHPRAPEIPMWPLAWSGTSVDGIDVAFNKGDPNIAYVIENDVFMRSTDSGVTWPIIFNSIFPKSQVRIFNNRLAVDPNTADRFYVGGSAGEVFQIKDGPPLDSRSLGILTPFLVTSIDVAPGDSNHVVAASGRQVFATTKALDLTLNPADGDVIFEEITADLPSRFVTRVAFDPNDANVVYATLSDYGGGHVFTKSIADPTAPWTDISPPCDIPVNAIALDGGANPAILYIGTDLGVLRRSVAVGATWEVVDDLHLPNATVSDLEINMQAGVLRAGTWGRGVFELGAPSGPVISVAETGLAFGETCASGADLAIHVSNIGSDNLVVSSVQRIAGSSSFTVLSSPSAPLTFAPGAAASFTVHYTPTIPGVAESAIIRISSNDPRVPFVDLVAKGNLETSPPDITSVIASPNVLTPPNHTMRPVAVSVTVTDNCDASVLQSCRIISVSSNEPVSGTGEGDTAPDWEITGRLSLRLRAERAGSGSGRIYTITVQCTDNAGNTATRSTSVTVPHP